MKLLLVGSSLVFGGVLFLGLRLFVHQGWSRRRRAVVWGALAVLAALIAWFPASWYLPIGLEGSAYAPLRAWLVFGAMGLFLLLLMTTAMRDAIALVVSATGAILRRVREEGRGGSPPDPERRRLLMGLSSWGVLVGSGLVGAAGLLSARGRRAVVDVTVRLEALPSALDGYQIVQISDLHVGNTIGRGYVTDVVGEVNALGADLVAITGDLTDGTVEMLREDVAPLAGLDARDGVFFVTGNHDYYFGDVEGWVREVARLGMTPLVNEHRTIERGGASLVVAGVTDHRGGDFLPHHRCDPIGALDGAPRGGVRIMLAHQPRSLRAVQAAGADLQLSGHTHGGQIFPFHLLAMLTQPALAGLHRFGRTWLYVSRGTGYWGPPLRVGAPAEITRITLRPA